MKINTITNLKKVFSADIPQIMLSATSLLCVLPCFIAFALSSRRNDSSVRSSTRRRKDFLFSSCACVYAYACVAPGGFTNVSRAYACTVMLIYLHRSRKPALTSKAIVMYGDAGI